MQKWRRRRIGSCVQVLCPIILPFRKALHLSGGFLLPLFHLTSPLKLIKWNVFIDIKYKSGLIRVMTRGRELTSFAVAGFIAYTDETDQA